MLRSPLLLLLLSCASLVRAQEPTGKPPAWTTWKGEGVSLAHPVEWSVDGTGQQGAAVIFYSPADSGDVFRENVNLLLQDAPGIDLTAYARNTEQQVREQLPKGEMLHSGGSRNATGEFHTFEYTGEINGIPLHWKQEVRLRDGKAYLITFTAHRDAWDEMLYLAEAIMGSFKWLE